MRLIHKLKRIIFGSSEDFSDSMIKLLRNKGATIGNNVRLFSNIDGPEAYLISIEDKVTIATGVRIITHDNSISKPRPEFSDLFGRVIIKRNSFIGAYSILLPGITVEENCIVAAGSVVTKSVPKGEIWGGVPAKKIGLVSDFSNRMKYYGLNTGGLSYSEKRTLLEKTSKLISK